MVSCHRLRPLVAAACGRRAHGRTRLCLVSKNTAAITPIPAASTLRHLYTGMGPVLPALLSTRAPQGRHLTYTSSSLHER
jgi:hypothetical protein